MHFLFLENILPAVIAVLAILISWRLWRKKYKSTNASSRGEASEVVERENIQSITAEKGEDKEDEVSFEEAANFLRNAGIIKSGEIQFLPEEERESILREFTDQDEDEEREKKIKEISVKEATNIQTYYKSTRLGIKEIEKQMTKEELDEERETQRKQLEEIFKLLETDQDKFGVTSRDDLADQMKLYSR